MPLDNTKMASRSLNGRRPGVFGIEESSQRRRYICLSPCSALTVQSPKCDGIEIRDRPPMASIHRQEQSTLMRC